MNARLQRRLAAASDDVSTGIIFATLTDDPGSAIDRPDAFVGKMMVEAASAADVVVAGSIRAAIIVEETNAGASPSAIVLDASGGIAAVMAETGAADSAQDATITGAFAVAVIDGTLVSATAASTVLGTEIIDSGPVTALD